jgi:OOP family OmpA-OmpF porin
MSSSTDSDLGLTKELVSPSSIKTKEDNEQNAQMSIQNNTQEGVVNDIRKINNNLENNIEENSESSINESSQEALEVSEKDSALSAEDQNNLMKELKNLLFSQEQEEISRLKERLNNKEIYAKEASDVLPKAINLSAKNGSALTESLQSSVEAAIKISVRKDPSALVDALFPVMGPAIRKAISQALSTMMQSLNQTMENSLSIQGLKWRLEAVRTGRSFAEIVLLNTLLYRVEQIFLIHKETGLLLQHLISPALLEKNNEIQDADMVSGMLTAIQDFARDSFGVQNESLEEFQVGELTVWIEQGPQAFLAGVLRGNAPRELRPFFQETLEKIHLDAQNQLKDFEGDSSVFEAIRPSLEACLQSQYGTKNEEKKASPALKIALGVISFFLLLWFSYWFWHYWHWQNYLDILKKEPGIVVTRISQESGKYFVSGLRDPLAKDPEELRKQVGLNESKVISQWEPYQAIKPEFILIRAKNILDPPNSVTLTLEGDTLIATGTASHTWIKETKRWSRLIAGINSFNSSKMTDLDLEELEKNKQLIEEESILFINGTVNFVEGQEKNLNKIVEALQVFTEKADLLDKRVQIEIFGQTDASGTTERNSILSQERADKIVSLLITRGLNSKYFTPKGIGTGNALTNEIKSPQNNESNRKVTFKISLIDSDFSQTDKK